MSTVHVEMGGIPAMQEGSLAAHTERVLTSPRLLTVFDVASHVGCHEETVRRAYLCGQLKRRRFGVRSWRFHPADVQEWIDRGAPTRAC
jgi:excisionase family DNA binding protein